jgi:hypothetical protein
VLSMRLWLCAIDGGYRVSRNGSGAGRCVT